MSDFDHPASDLAAVIPEASPPPHGMASIFHADDLVYFENSRSVAEGRIYNWYAAYGASLRPRSILEIGVRRGYGGHALIVGAGGTVARYLGIDMELDLAGGNAGAAQALRALGVTEVSVVKADTRKGFPLIAGKFDLIHIDGDHSARGALNDICLALPLLAPGGSMIVDDVHTRPVRDAARLALLGLGSSVEAIERGDLRRQMLIRSRGGPLTLDLQSTLAAAPVAIRARFNLDEALAALFALRDDGGGEAATVERFSSIVEAAAFAIGTPVPSCTDAGSVFASFAELSAALSAMAAKRGVGLCPWEKEGRGHACYALSRLDDVVAPPMFAPVMPQPNIFRRGTAAFDAMLQEAARNLARVLSRAVDQLRDQ